jgi:hypothetical protein
MILPLFLTSCTGEVEDVFSEGASQRMQTALAKYRELLTAAPNGWIADYYPEVNYRIGGYAMFFEFDKEGNVAICCEIPTGAEPNVVNPGEKAVSQWELIPEQGPVLSFLSHNTVLHHFGEPSQADINGMQGDFEFVVMNATPDVIELVGKREKNKLFLRNNKDDLDPVEYFTATQNNEMTHSGYPVFRFDLNGTAAGRLATIDRTFTSDIKDEAGNILTLPYCFTPTGLRLANPVVINGVTVQNFVLNEAEEKYTCSDPGVDIVLQSYMPDDYQLQYKEILGTWRMDWFDASNNPKSGTFEIVERKKNSTFLITSSQLAFDGIILTFAATTGITSIFGQRVFKSQTNSEKYVWICPWGEGYVHTNLTVLAGLVGVWNKDKTNPSLTFVDNGVWGARKADGLALYLSDGSSRETFNGNPAGNRFRNISLTKITE